MGQGGAISGLIIGVMYDFVLSTPLGLASLVFGAAAYVAGLLPFLSENQRGGRESSLSDSLEQWESWRFHLRSRWWVSADSFNHTLSRWLRL